MIVYLFKSTLCSGIFLLVYLLLLEKEKMHRFNRWYLLGSILFSLIIPLISINIHSQALPVLQDIQDRYTEIINAGNSGNTPPSAEQTPASLDWKNILLIIYAAVCIGLLIRFSRNINRLLIQISSNRVVSFHKARLVLLKENVVSHTFLNHIFLSEAEYTYQSIEKEILVHELTHVKEKHSWDILFIELVKAIFWFNPLFLFYKKAIQLNHEFLADEAVLKTYDNIPAYQYLLLDKISLGNNAILSSPFNFSVTKKRLVMMTRTTNQISMLLKKLSILPLLAGMVIILCTKQLIAQKQNESPIVSIQDTLKPKPAQLRSVFPGDLPILRNAGVSRESIDEYNSIVERNMSTKGKGQHAIHVTDEERKKLLTIYRQMNWQQRHDAIVGFAKRFDPGKKVFPTAAQLEKWKNPSDYGVWIDDKKVTNDKLNNYRASDFSYYDASNLAYTEKMKKDIMERYNLKTMYKVQLNLMTNNYYENYYRETMSSPAYVMYYHTTHDTNNRAVEWRIRIEEIR